MRFNHKLNTVNVDIFACINFRELMTLYGIIINMSNIQVVDIFADV